MSEQLSLTVKPIVAVMDIGSSAIRLVVAEAAVKGPLRYLENIQKSVGFGKDVFATGRLSQSTIREALGVLKDYKDTCDRYGVSRLQAVATSAVREASNRDTFLDQVFVRTGIDVEILEGPEENRLELIAVEHALQGQFDFEKRNAIIMEVGSGSTEIILTAQGQVTLTRTLPVGTLRLPEQVSPSDAASLPRVIKRYSHNIVNDFKRDVSFADIDLLIALGSTMRFLSHQLPEPDGEKLFRVLKTKDFLDLLRAISKMSVEDIVDTYGLVYEDAETLHASLLLYAGFLAETKAEEIVIPMLSIRDGLLNEMAQIASGAKRTDVARQITNSAKSLGRKYHYDDVHSHHVTQLALQLFDALKADHGLGPRERLLLEVAGILHDIGMFISPASHHKHGSYLIDAADIFGLRKLDKDIVSQVVRYHRKSPPKPSHVPYMSLRRPDRAVVSKLAAILRVAEALDKSHQQKIKDLQLERKGEGYVLWVPEQAGDVSLERRAVEEKGKMMADVLGSTLNLKQGKP